MFTPKLVTTLRDYSWSAFGTDALAGITVGLVALPLSLAIAIASGATPAQGLVTAIVGGLIVSALGGSRVQIGGPTGAFIVVVYGVIAEHGMDGLILATLMAGAILLVAGLLRAGSLVAYVPEPVINGFTLGIGIVIGTSQLRDALGLETTHLPAEFIGKIEALWTARDTFNWQALALTVFTIVLIRVMRFRLPPKVPGLIFAVAIGSALALIPGAQIDTVGARFGELSAALPAPTLPAFSFDKVRELLPTAFVIAFLAGVESLLSAVVADRMCGGAHRPRAELIAQGWANIGSALFAGLPVTGAIARTATNVKAGGRTPVAGIVHALTVLAVMLLAAPLAGRLAMPAMAALLMLTAWNMSEPDKWKGYVTGPRQDAFLVFLTMALTVLVDLTVAIGVGVALGFALRRRSRERPAQEWHPREK